MADDGDNMIERLAGTRVLVTGASGFIGGRLCMRLAEAGAEVTGLSRHPQPGGAIRWLACDVSDEAEVRKAVAEARPEIVYHLASHVAGARGAEWVAPTFHANLASTVYLMSAALEAGVSRFVQTGSQEEPDGAGGDTVPTSPYAAAKWAASAYARMFHALYDFPVVHLRVFMVYGPGQKDLKKLVPYTILEALAGRAPKIGSGTRRVDWVYVDDVVRAMLLAATAPGAAGKSVEIGTGVLTTVREVVEMAAAAANPAVVPEFGAAADRKMEVERAADPSPAKALLGWTPEVAVPEGLMRTAAWYRQALEEGRLS